MLLDRNTNIGFLLMGSLFLICSSARADFGTGTITFDETSYTVYDFSNTSNTSNVTVADDLAIGLDEAFGVDTDNDDTADVFVRMGFSRTSDNNIDADDINAVFEDTSRNGFNVEYRHTYSPTESLKAYVSNDVSWDTNNGIVTDAVESGYETQAGDYFVRSAQDGDTGYSRGSASDDDWTQFVIEYAGSAVTSATGEIWDIDYSGVYERFDVKAYSDLSATTQIGSTQQSPLGIDPTDANSYDAKPWAWSFDGIGNIAKIVFTRSATTDAAGNNPAGASTQFPLAFNNFNPVSSVGFTSAVPEPSTLAVFAVGSVGIAAGGITRRRKQKA